MAHISPEELKSAVTDHNGCIRITCRVQPRSSRCGIAGMYDGALKIALTAPPVEGKANAALCDFFSQKFKCPKSAVAVVSGAASKNKIVEVQGIAFQSALEKLA